MAKKAEVNKQEEQQQGMRLPTPSEMKAYLDKFIIGQDEAKKVVCVAVYNHYKRVLNNQNEAAARVHFDKSNILIHGDSGCGKTMIFKTLAQMLNVPCYIQDCTKITASGYVGGDVEECLVGLLRSCNYNVMAAQQGIVILDEIDKTAKKEGANMSITRDVSGECVQQSLLKIVEGDLIGVPPAGGRKHPEQQLIYVDTTNILFVACGAFVGLKEIVKNRVNTGSSIGFDCNNADKVDDKEVGQYLMAEDLKNYGFIPEFIGRFPVITGVNKLEREDLKRILTEPVNSILLQYTELLRMDDTELEFTDEALDFIVDLAYRTGTGARSLRSVVDAVLQNIMFEAPDNAGKGDIVKIVIDEKFVREKTAKKFKFKKDK